MVDKSHTHAGIGMKNRKIYFYKRPITPQGGLGRHIEAHPFGDLRNHVVTERVTEIAGANLLTTREVKDAFTKAALALPSEGDRANVLASAAKSQ